MHALLRTIRTVSRVTASAGRSFNVCGYPLLQAYIVKGLTLQRFFKKMRVCSIEATVVSYATDLSSLRIQARDTNLLLRGMDAAVLHRFDVGR